VLGTFLLQPCEPPWTLRIIPAAELTLLQQSARVLTFLNTGDTPFPMVLIGRELVSYTTNEVVASIYRDEVNSNKWNPAERGPFTCRFYQENPIKKNTAEPVSYGFTIQQRY
jgi:hypothetical protein